MRKSPNILKLILNFFGGNHNVITNPPSHLEWLLKPVENRTLKVIQEDYGDWTNAFKFFSGYKDSNITNLNKEGNIESDKLFYKDEYSGKRILLFDRKLHGYNGQLNVFENDDFDSDTKNELIKIDLESSDDSKCCFVFAFQYSRESTDYIERGNSHLPEDYFDWIVIYKKCGNKMDKIFEYECS